MAALAHRPRRQQASRPAKPDPASARQYPVQEGRRRLAEDSQGAAAAQECYRGPWRRPANSQPLLTFRRAVWPGLVWEVTADEALDPMAAGNRNAASISGGVASARYFR